MQLVTLFQKLLKFEVGSESATFIEINGGSIPVRLRRKGSARRIILRLDNDGSGVIVTLPKWASEAEGLSWAEQQKSWIENRIDALPQRIAFIDGAEIPFEGANYIIRHYPNARRGVWREKGEIRVSGHAEYIARRVRDWLRREAKLRLAERTADVSKILKVRAGRVTVRDTRSRWGSCALNGNISYSWRLILAPKFVLDYVVAHEVAHLKEHNHGPVFWETVAMLEPEVNRARRWLREQGESLHFIG